MTLDTPPVIHPTCIRRHHWGVPGGTLP